MKCTSCESEINPKWKHAVESNLCPFCGQLIMDAALKALLSTLSVTLDKLSEHPDHLEDWLRTHGYVREDKIVYAPPPVATGMNTNNQVPLSKDTLSIQNQEVTNKFFKNAEATKIMGKTQHYKEMVNQIKKQGATTLTANTLGGMINPEDLNTADPQVVADLQEILGTSPEIASSLQDNGGDGEDEIHPIALAMAQVAGGGKGGQTNAKDLMKLQQLQSKTASARNRMLNGSGGKGSFSRS